MEADFKKKIVEDIYKTGFSTELALTQYCYCLEESSNC